MTESINKSTARAILGMDGATINKRLPATFDVRRARAELSRVTKVSTFDDLSTIKELAHWLPEASDTLAQVLGAALLVDGEEFTPEQRIEAATTAVDEFRDALLERIAGGIGKRHGAKVSTRKDSAAVAKADTSWQRGIL